MENPLSLLQQRYQISPLQCTPASPPVLVIQDLKARHSKEQARASHLQKSTGGAETVGQQNNKPPWYQPGHLSSQIVHGRRE